MNLKYIRSTIVVLGLVFSQNALAHSSLQTSPQDGDTLQNSPDSILIQYEKLTKILKFSIKNSDDTKIEFTKPPKKGFMKTYRSTVKDLPAGVYTVKWTAIGEDGHPTKSKFSFTIQ